MKVEINSIKNRILLGFLPTVVGVGVLGLVSLFYLNKTSQIRKISRLLNQIESQSLHLIKTDNDFFDIESINQDYFISKKSKLLDKRNDLYMSISKDMDFLHQQDEIEIFKTEAVSIQSLLENYNQKFLLLSELIYDRGFKDYGLEGKMRTFAHQLEYFTDEIDLSHILSLRRHEKDFFLRNDTTYIELLNTTSKNIISSLEESGSSDSSAMLIRMYTDTFNKLADLQKIIGLSSNEGLRNELNELTTMLDNQFNILSKKSEAWSLSISRRIMIVFCVVLIAVIGLTITWGRFISNKLSKPIKRLDAIIRNVTQTDLKGLIEVPLKNPDSEIENLSQSFLALMRKAKVQMKEIRDKSNELHIQNQELINLNNELDSFIYSTAHDLRSPLASLLGLVNLAEMEDSAPRREEYIGHMKNSIQKMDSFISDVVAYSKNKKLEVIYEQFNIRTLIEDIFEEHKFVRYSDCINKKVKISGSEGELIHSDKTRLRIVLSNLISNAIRYADVSKESPSITVNIYVTLDMVAITFSDNGIGIKEQYLDKIFEMFFRASESSPGSGLGLFILKETINKLGGVVKVSSQYTVGTTFHITIPNNTASKNMSEGKQILMFA